MAIKLTKRIETAQLLVFTERLALAKIFKEFFLVINWTSRKNFEIESDCEDVGFIWLLTPWPVEYGRPSKSVETFYAPL